MELSGIFLLVCNLAILNQKVKVKKYQTFGWMMSVGARSWRVVKPHIPLIKFRKGGIEPHQATNHNQSSHIKNHPSSSKNASQISTVLDDTELPLKYSRKPLTQEEIEAIERGGPE